MSRLARAALALLLAGACGACAASPAAGLHAAARDRSPHLEDAFDGPPALLVVVRPARLTRDPLYGPLVRRASELAAARVAVGEAVGATALSALERTDEVILGAYDHDARDAVVALRGVPADIDAARVLDTNGKPLWQHARDLPGGVEELAPADATAKAALFVLPRREWVIAVGDAAPRARAAFADERHRDDAGLEVADEPLVVASLRGAALLRARPSLTTGPLAPVVRDLDVVTLGLEPGPEGAVGEVVARLVYGEPAFAERSEACVNEVLAAFTRRFEKAPWLHAVKVSRDGSAVVVRGRIPRAWADGLLHVDLSDIGQ
jgi:hypothetical protein